MKALENAITTINDIVEQTYYFEQKVYEMNQKVNKNKSAISKALGRKNRLDIKVDDQTEFSAIKETKVNIEFFPDKLKATLDKEMYEKVIDKHVGIRNLEGLISMLKEYGVPPKRFKDYLEVKHEVSNEKIDHQIEMGNIDIENIAGCYKVDFDEEIRVKKTK